MNEVWITDPDAAHVVLSRRKDYFTSSLQSLSYAFWLAQPAVEGDDWQRHRKLTAPSFNEKTSSSVREGSLRQARDMLQSWMERGVKGTIDTVSDTATLTLHMLTGAGFGIWYSYGKGVQNPLKGHSLWYRDAFLTVLLNIVLLSLIPKSWLAFPYSPAKLRRLGLAMREFQAYMVQMLNNERSQISKRQLGSCNLLTALIRASEEAKQSSHGDISRQGLRDVEIYGNIFMYNAAGYETTANTIATGIVLMADHREWQEWLAEELNLVFDEDTSPSGDYEKAFPTLSRCRAVMVCFVKPQP